VGPFTSGHIYCALKPLSPRIIPSALNRNMRYGCPTSAVDCITDTSVSQRTYPDRLFVPSGFHRQTYMSRYTYPCPLISIISISRPECPSDLYRLILPIKQHVNDLYKTECGVMDQMSFFGGTGEWVDVSSGWKGLHSLTSGLLIEGFSKRHRFRKPILTVVRLRYQKPGFHRAEHWCAAILKRENIPSLTQEQ